MSRIREPWTHREEQVGDLRLHWVEAGEGPLVLLLHGFPELWLAWRNQVPALAAAGFRAVAPDLRGYNLSEKPRGVSSYRMERLAGDVANLVRHLGYEKTFLVGHDWGGAIAWCVPALHPGLVERLAILNAPHPILFRKKLATLAQARRSSYVFFFQLPCLPERSLTGHRAGFLARMLRRDPVTPGAFSPEEIEAYREAFLRPGAATAAINYYRAAVRSGTRIPGLRRSLEDVPTLVLWGEKDRYLGPELLDGLETLVPDLRLVRVPDASHWLPADAPGKVNAELLRFFRE
ncbi:MAG TPA: alpha/beta hydrolase [Thermoanaerobaculia bacterium]|nr:alpha/beta hydrolase [Thermoanaerobaculia bacterium]HQP86987.1 alpha/beta hydrolase [Thermoanaerobaculia bacterium]